MQIISLLVAVATISLLVTAEDKKEEEQKLQWKDDDGLEIKIIRPIKADKCTIKSQKGDVVDQYYKLTDKSGKEIGSNFGKEPYTFTLGSGLVIPGMERAMLGMCIGEKRKVVIPGKLGFGDEGRDRDSIAKDQTLYYTVQLVDLFRHVPGEKWETPEGVVIEVTHKIDEDKCKKSASGDTIHQQYVLHLENGTMVDSSWQRNKPFIFKLNKGEVIKGMDIAMTNMCEGEKRKVIIPYELGYGAEESPKIPAKSRLYFDITLEKLIKKDEL